MSLTIYNLDDWLQDIISNTFRGHSEAQEDNSMGLKLTLLDISIEVILPQSQANLSKVVQMVLFGFAINQDIIKIDHNKFSYEHPKDLSHDPHKDMRCIGQTKRHHYPFVQTILSLKSSLPLIPKSNPNLMVVLGMMFQSQSSRLQMVELIVNVYVILLNK